MSNWRVERRAHGMIAKNGVDWSTFSGPGSTLQDDSEEESAELPGAYAISRERLRGVVERHPSVGDEVLNVPSPSHPRHNIPIDRVHRRPPAVLMNEFVDELSNEKFSQSTRKWVVLFFLVLIVLSVGLALILLLTKKDVHEVTAPDIISVVQECKALGQISTFSDIRKEHYDSMKNLTAVQNHPDAGMSMNSCDPANIALVWVSLEYQMWEEQGIDQWEQRLTSRLALAWLYFSSSGEDWTNNSNWATTQSECTWYGISCDDQNKVIGVTLPMNGLKGPLGTWVALLPYLKKLDLTGNRLGGSIPWEISSFSKIEDLRLGNNVLTGSLPSHMSAFTNLIYFFLHENQITGTLPSQLYLLTALKELNLNSTRLSGSIPSTGWGMMSQLEALDWSRNDQLSGIFPASLTLLTNLKTLMLSETLLQGTIPDSLGSMISLVSLSASTTRLEGTIPTSIGQLTNLQFLDLSAASFDASTIPLELGLCTKLETLVLQLNRFTGTIPNNFAALSSLALFDVSGNSALSGIIPEGFNRFDNLTTLSISSTSIDWSTGICNHSAVVHLSCELRPPECSCCRCLN